jgi:hypothetical protein
MANKRIGTNELKRMQSKKVIQANKVQKFFTKMIEKLPILGLVTLIFLMLGIGAYILKEHGQKTQSSLFDWTKQEFSIALDSNLSIGTDSYIAQSFDGNRWVIWNENGLGTDFPRFRMDLPVLECSNNHRLKLLEFLEVLKKEENQVFSALSQLECTGDTWKIWLKNFPSTLKLHATKEPVRNLKNFWKFLHMYENEIRSASTIDLRFSGFIYASRGTN